MKMDSPIAWTVSRDNTTCRHMYMFFFQVHSIDCAPHGSAFVWLLLPSSQESVVDGLELKSSK